MRHGLTLALGMALGFLGSVVTQTEQAPDPRSPLELCRVELVSVRGQLVTEHERANTLQSSVNRQALAREQQEVKAAIEAAHPGCVLDFVSGTIICELVDETPPVDPEKP